MKRTKQYLKDVIKYHQTSYEVDNYVSVGVSIGMLNLLYNLMEEEEGGMPEREGVGKDKTIFDILKPTEKTKKPPMGIIPKKIWLEERASNLARAIKDYVDAGKIEPLDEWIAELGEIVWKLEEIQEEEQENEK